MTVCKERERDRVDFAFKRRVVVTFSQKEEQVRIHTRGSIRTKTHTERDHSGDRDTQSARFIIHDASTKRERERGRDGERETPKQILHVYISSFIRNKPQAQ